MKKYKIVRFSHGYFKGGITKADIYPALKSAGQTDSALIEYEEDEDKHSNKNLL